jgi:hypothetical protein
LSTQSQEKAKSYSSHPLSINLNLEKDLERQKISRSFSALGFPSSDHRPGDGEPVLLPGAGAKTLK